MNERSSSVRMIGVAIAFLAPWILALAFILWVIRKISTKNGEPTEKPPVD